VASGTVKKSRGVSNGDFLTERHFGENEHEGLVAEHEPLVRDELPVDNAGDANGELQDPVFFLTGDIGKPRSGATSCAIRRGFPGRIVGTLLPQRVNTTTAERGIGGFLSVTGQ
jgi:hypothetical protein